MTDYQSTTAPSTFAGTGPGRLPVVAAGAGAPGATSPARPSVIQLVFREKGALYAAYVPAFVDVGLPVLTYLRDTQNYVQAAAHGMTIFDLPASRAAQDWQQWQPILDWADGN